MHTRRANFEMWYFRVQWSLSHSSKQKDSALRMLLANDHRFQLVLGLVTIKIFRFEVRNSINLKGTFCAVIIYI